MPVIKADNLKAQAAAAFSMADIEKQARLVLLGAKARAERLLETARQEAEALGAQAAARAHADGHRAGLAEGLARGLDQGRQQGREEALAEHGPALAAAVAALSRAASDLDAARLRLEADALQAVVELAVAIADRVTKRLGALDPRVALANVEEALRLVVSRADVRIAVHPDHLATLADALPRLRAEWPDLKHVELVADPALTPGGCRIATAGGQIDADLQLQLDRIAAELVPAPAPDPALPAPPPPEAP